MPGSVQLAISSAWLRFIARPDRGHRALVRRSRAGVARRERRSARLRRLGSDSSLGGSCLAPEAWHEVGASGEEKDDRDREAEKPVLRPETCLLHLNRPLGSFRCSRLWAPAACGDCTLALTRIPRRTQAPGQISCSPPSRAPFPSGNWTPGHLPDWAGIAVGSG